MSDTSSQQSLVSESEFPSRTASEAGALAEVRELLHSQQGEPGRAACRAGAGRRRRQQSGRAALRRKLDVVQALQLQILQDLQQLDREEEEEEGGGTRPDTGAAASPAGTAARPVRGSQCSVLPGPITPDPAPPSPAHHPPPDTELAAAEGGAGEAGLEGVQEAGEGGEGGAECGLEHQLGTIQELPELGYQSDSSECGELHCRLAGRVDKGKHSNSPEATLPTLHEEIVS